MMDIISHLGVKMFGFARHKYHYIKHYIFYRNRLNKIIRSATFKYQTDLFDKCEHDCKQIWANINDGFAKDKKQM